MTEPEIEINQFEDEPNPERLEAIQNACNIFAQISRMVPQLAPKDENDFDEIVNGILRRNGDLTDSMNYTLEWRAIREKRQEAARREAELEAKEQAHLREVEEYKRPSSEDRARILEENRRQQQAPPPKEFVPAREYTDAEMSAMSSAEYRRLVLGSITAEDRQGNSGYEFKPVVRVKPGHSTKPTLRNLKKRLENL